MNRRTFLNTVAFTAGALLSPTELLKAKTDNTSFDLRQAIIQGYIRTAINLPSTVITGLGLTRNTADWMVFEDFWLEIPHVAFKDTMFSTRKEFDLPPTRTIKSGKPTTQLMSLLRKGLEHPATTVHNFRANKSTHPIWTGCKFSIKIPKEIG